LEPVFSPITAIFVLLILLAVPTTIGLIARRKNRSFILWFIAGCVFAPMAFIAILCVPKIEED
jgi:hypothetical protein